MALILSNEYYFLITLVKGDCGTDNFSEKALQFLIQHWSIANLKSQNFTKQLTKKWVV